MALIFLDEAAGKIQRVAEAVSIRLGFIHRGSTFLFNIITKFFFSLND